MEEAHLPEKFQDSRGKWSEYPSYNPLDAVDMLVLSLATDPDPLNQQVSNLWTRFKKHVLIFVLDYHVGLVSVVRHAA